MDQLIHEDAGDADHSNLHETQSRAARKNCLYFDAWISLLGLVHGEFSWAAGSAMILLNGFTLHYLCGRQRVMDEVQGSSKRGGKHLHADDKAFHKEEACFFEQGPCSAHMVLINKSGSAFGTFAELLVLNKDFIWMWQTCSFTNCVNNYEKTVGFFVVVCGLTSAKMLTDLLY